MIDPAQNDENDAPEAIAARKGALRQNLRGARAMMAHAAGPLAARRIAERGLALLRRLAVPEGAVVAGYHAVGQELDVIPLLRALDQAGFITALPVVPEETGPLLFHRWRPGEPLKEGRFAVPVPAFAAPVTPQVVIVPLLGFDRRGFRLGQGGGHYDRTLAHLRANGDIVAIGAAYSGQELDRVPREAHDAPLDWILTDRETIGPFTDGA
ncbi:5-formyltetrahydrofolate cyclo-ligase [Thermopetrobacter sp. TC1]|uniref:5-formyltetrahydrofolate cyclo-ligase n=1 Tax=Thermopetrobacter sp. TC1 TaxID=1495045 RepID=UPI00056E8F32|nr:5-formyltetrahydrofolate cyclo-ligase [Thermopetrobacter sp. TC1]